LDSSNALYTNAVSIGSTAGQVLLFNFKIRPEQKHTHTYGSKESENFLATQRQVFSKLCPTLLGVLLEIELDFIWQQAEQSPIHLRCKKLLGLVPSISCSSRTLFISKEKMRCNHIESLQSKNFASYPKKICVPKK